MEYNIKNLRFDKDGLIPVIIQDYYSNQVLTMAYMNEESLDITLKERKTCFYSRSRKELWRKGETSGNYQNVVSISSDCDNDALLIKVIKDGPACHLGKESCFSNSIFNNDEYNSSENKDFSIIDLYNLIKDRKDNKNENSYTSYLFQKGLDKILKKIGEECTEVIIGAKNSDREELIYELSDLVYHSLVLMIEKDISINDIMLELKSRQIIDKKIKQEKMV